VIAVSANRLWFSIAIFFTLLIGCKKPTLPSAGFLSLEEGNYARSALSWTTPSARPVAWGLGQIVYLKKINPLQRQFVLSGRYDLSFVNEAEKKRADVDCSQQGLSLLFESEVINPSRWRFVSQKGVCDTLGALKFDLQYSKLTKVSEKGFTLVGRIKIEGLTREFEESFERGYP
jgi:hypothetical protein